MSLLLAAVLLAAPAGEVDAQVAEYLATAGDDRARALEAGLASVPFATIEEAVRRAAWGVGKPGPDELEVVAGGARTRALVQLPPGYTPERAWPLVLSIPGAGEGAAQERSRWVAQFREGEREFVVVCPEETAEQRGKGWGSSEVERALQLRALDEALRRYRIDPDRVFLAGVSRGGHATWELGLLHADRFAGLYANAGGPRLIHFGWLDNLGRVPLLEVLGARDDPLLVANVRTAVERLRKAGASIVFHEDPDAGHLVGFGHDGEFAGWIAEKRRDLWPKRIAHGFSRLDQGRAFWLEATRLSGKVLDPTASRPSVKTPPGRKTSDEELRRLFAKQVEEGVARIEGTVEGNRIELRTRKVAEVVVYLSEKLVDLDQPVEVRVNGKRRFQGKVTRDGLGLLRHVRATGDRGRLVACSLRVSAG